MQMAFLVATRATCDRRHVGAVIVQDNHIIATGYNGSPPGQEHCDDVGHLLVSIDGRPSCQRTTHAEQNAIIAAAKFGHATKGAKLYITDQPCANCSKAIIAAGIERVEYYHGYPDYSGLKMLSTAGIRATNSILFKDVFVDTEYPARRENNSIGVNDDS